VPGGVAITPDGTTLAANRGAGRVGVWDLDSGDELTTLAGPGSIAALAHSADGALLAAAGVAGVTVWSTDEFEVVAELWTDRPAEDVEFRPDGRALLVSGLDGMQEYAIGSGGVAAEPSIAHTDALSFFARYRPATTDIVRAYDISDQEAELFVELADARNGRWVEDLLDSGAETDDAAADEAEGGAPAVDGAESSADADDQAVDAVDAEPADDATAVALAEDFVAAMDARDVGAAREVVASDATYDVHYTDWGTDLALVFDWLDAAGWRFDPQGCEVVGAGRVRCAVEQRNAWSEVFSGATAPGTVNLTVDVDGIVAVRYEFDQWPWIEVATFPFFGFVAGIDEQDAEALFDTSIHIVRPYPTQENVDLIRRYTEELVAAHES
jgi:hypothetical protein